MSNIYIIASYIPSDENKVVSNIYKLIQLGSKNKKYIFVCITDTGGVGTGLDDFGDTTIEDSIITAINILSSDMFTIQKCTLNEAVEIQNEQILTLQNNLK